jgi:hypothetical protein
LMAAAVCVLFAPRLHIPGMPLRPFEQLLLMLMAAMILKRAVALVP